MQYHDFFISFVCSSCVSPLMMRQRSHSSHLTQKMGSGTFCCGSGAAGTLLALCCAVQQGESKRNARETTKKKKKDERRARGKSNARGLTLEALEEDWV